MGIYIYVLNNDHRIYIIEKHVAALSVACFKLYMVDITYYCIINSMLLCIAFA